MDDVACSHVVLSAAGFDRGAVSDPVADAVAIVGQDSLREVAQALTDPWVAAGGSILHRSHRSWPMGLEALGDAAPVLLWLRGTAPTDPGQAVAVVGSRRCTDYGITTASDIAATVVGTGRWVVSGGAVGIDGAAHRAALTAGGRTLLVAAGGGGRIYPEQNADLFDQVTQRGGVVWEHPPGTRLERSGFLRRNRLISAIAGTTVVVEAAERSGALNTARTAADLGRLVLGVPGPVSNNSSAGVHRAVADGWAALLLGRGDLEEVLGPVPV